MESCSFVSESYVNDLKHCSFLLPHDYVVPDALRRVSPMEFSNVLTLSAEIFESLQHSSQTIQFQDLLKKEKAKLEKEKAKVEKGMGPSRDTGAEAGARGGGPLPRLRGQIPQGAFQLWRNEPLVQRVPQI